MTKDATQDPRQRRCILRSPSAARRLSHAAIWLGERGRATELVVVGTTSESATELTRRVGCEIGASFGWHHFTLARLAWAVAGPPLARKELSPVGALALEAVCARIVHANAANGTLGRFAPIGDRPGLPRALARTFAELRLATVDPKSLGDGDLARLLGDYERELAEAQLVDRSELFATATALVDEGAAPQFTGQPLLLLDVPIHTERELRFVRALAARSAELLVTIPAGDERTFAACEVLDCEIVADPQPANTPLQRLQWGLFAEMAVKPDKAGGIVLFSAPGESRECVEIARLIHREAEGGVPFDQMAVLLRSPMQYRSHLEEAFRRAGIPAHFARGTARPDPTGRAFLALLACAAQGLSAARFAEYLSIGEVPDATETGSPPAAARGADRWVPPDDELLSDAATLAASAPSGETPNEAAALEGRPVADGTLRAPRLWEQLIVDAAVIGGLDRWRRRLDGLRAQFEISLAELEDPEDANAVRFRRMQEALGELRAYALPLLEELAALPGSAPWGDWLDQLGSLATRALRHPARVLSVLAELAPMAEVGPVDLAEVRIVLERRLTDVITPPSLRRFGRVFVGSTDEARGLVFDVVFVPGLAEKLFPLKIAEDPILPDLQRDAMTAGLPTNADRAVLERLALRIAVGAAKKRVVLSYPRLDLEQSRPRTPSFYSLEVLRASEGELPGFDELARRSNTTGAARIGWPAPSRSEDAIDHAEHDLALLETIMKRPEAETAGTARYLLSANVHLARALRFRAKRWLRKWTDADGIVAPADQARVALAAHALSARSYSPTGLQNYAACPYRFVLQAIHRLSPREDPAPLEELDPLHKGSLIHEVQFEFYSTLREEKLLPISARNIETARAHLQRVVDRVVARYADELAPAIERVWADGIAGVRADLLEWLRRASEDTRWSPLFFELSFGLQERHQRDRQSSEAPARLDSGIQLRGSIDLVEKRETGALRATDYKTGKARAPQGTLIGGGEVLQPVMYALALEKLLPDQAVEGGRLYYCTAAGEFAEVDVPLDAPARQAAQLVADTVQKALSDGFLPAAPKKGACEYCDYLRVCGPSEELRTARKKGDQLTGLQKLRSHP
jgi:ATP-dependent helicase/nuclease subunit B